MRELDSIDVVSEDIVTAMPDETSSYRYLLFSSAKFCLPRPPLAS